MEHALNGHGLTARQLEVAELAADGYSIIEIAEELGDLTPRTVKSHLDVVRRKLGVSKKREIGRALRQVT